MIPLPKNRHAGMELCEVDAIERPTMSLLGTATTPLINA